LLIKLKAGINYYLSTYSIVLYYTVL